MAEKTTIDLTVRNDEIVQTETRIIQCTERTTWNYVKEWLITPLGGRVDGNPRVAGVGRCGCEWLRTGVVEDCYSGSKYLFTRPVEAYIRSGVTMETFGAATGHGCLCSNPNGELQLWITNPRRVF